jgi:hypothetical protein
VAGLRHWQQTVEDEWDFTLEWRAVWKPLDGLWIRAQFAHATTNQAGTVLTIDGGRVILNYRVKML